MSIWISKAALCGLILLAACQGVAPTGRTAPVLDGAFAVAVPQGYCIDRSTIRESDDTAVVLMGRCSDASTALPAVLTLSVAQAGSAGVMADGGAALAAFFTSAQGRATLARSGRAQDVTVVTAKGAADAFVMRVQDRAVGDYWRAIVGLRGRLVTVSASGTGDAPLPPEEGRKLLDKALGALRAANRASAV